MTTYKPSEMPVGPAGPDLGGCLETCTCTVASTTGVDDSNAVMYYPNESGELQELALDGSMVYKNQYLFIATAVMKHMGISPLHVIFREHR